jgi:hypothetical protein
VAEPVQSPTLEALGRAVREKERELSELDLILADYHAERCRLIDELRRLRAQQRDAEEPTSPSPSTTRSV